MQNSISCSQVHHFFIYLPLLIYGNIWKSHQDDSSRHPVVMFCGGFLRVFTSQYQIGGILFSLIATCPRTACNLLGAEILSASHAASGFSCWYVGALEVNDHLPGWTVTTPYCWQNCMFALHRSRFLLKGRKASAASLPVIFSPPFFPFFFLVYIELMGLWQAATEPSNLVM